jgi:hypothetical protein
MTPITIRIESMMKKLAFIALLVFLSPSYLWAQEESNLSKYSSAEEIDASFQEELFMNYASIVVDLGPDLLLNAPETMKLNLLKIKWPNLYLYYNIPIKESHFMVSPGLGFGRNRYTFKDEYTLARNKTSRHTELEKADSLLGNNPTINSSSLDVKYVDLVTEFRFNANRLEPQDGFFLAVGGNLGIRYDAYTTIEYKEDGQTKTHIIAESFNLNRLRYGLIARIGWGRFGAFYSHTLSNLFNNQGPTKNNIHPFSFGVSLNLL